MLGKTTTTALIPPKAFRENCAGVSESSHRNAVTLGGWEKTAKKKSSSSRKNKSIEIKAHYKTTSCAFSLSNARGFFADAPFPREAPVSVPAHRSSTVNNKDKRTPGRRQQKTAGRQRVHCTNQTPREKKTNYKERKFSSTLRQVTMGRKDIITRSIPPPCAPLPTPGSTEKRPRMKTQARFFETNFIYFLVISAPHL